MSIAPYELPHVRASPGDCAAGFAQATRKIRDTPEPEPAQRGAHRHRERVALVLHGPAHHVGAPVSRTARFKDPSYSSTTNPELANRRRLLHGQLSSPCSSGRRLRTCRVRSALHLVSVCLSVCAST
jgi:hypothetical protein